MNDIVSLVQGNASSRSAKASQFPQGVVTLFTSIANIPKPELFDWKLSLISENTSVVLTPYIVTLITVTNPTGVCT